MYVHVQDVIPRQLICSQTRLSPQPLPVPCLEELSLPCLSPSFLEQLVHAGWRGKCESFFFCPPQVDWVWTAPDQPRRLGGWVVLVVGDFCLASRKCQEAMEKLSITNSNIATAAVARLNRG